MSSNGGASLGGNRTMVGLRALTTTTQVAPRKVQKRQGPDEAKKLDRVERADPDEEKRRELLKELEEPEPEAEPELTQPPGHVAHLRRFEGEAFRKDTGGRAIAPSYLDVDQGNLADAWLLAACAAVAAARPEALNRRVRRRGPEDFVVELGRDLVIVTPEFPSEGYADPTPNGQNDTLWVALMEKAFALREAGSYALLETGSSARALEAIMQESARRVSLGAHLPPERIWAQLKAAAAAKAPMVLKTHARGVPAPLVAEHSYAVLEICERGAERRLRVYNPWGTSGGKRTPEETIHELDLMTLLTAGEAIYLAGA